MATTRASLTSPAHNGYASKSVITLSTAAGGAAMSMLDFVRSDMVRPALLSIVGRRRLAPALARGPGGRAAVGAFTGASPGFGPRYRLSGSRPRGRGPDPG